MNKQDYKLSILWDLNGNTYFELFYKGVKKFMNENEKEFILKELEALINKLK